MVRRTDKVHPNSLLSRVGLTVSTLIMIDQAPYGTWSGREALDMAFSLAAFDQAASLLFTGAGVHWLKKG